VVANRRADPSDIIALFMGGSMQEIDGARTFKCGRNKGEGAAAIFGMGSRRAARIPDGYTVLLADELLFGQSGLYASLALDPFTDFAAISENRHLANVSRFKPGLAAKHAGKEVVALGPRGRSGPSSTFRTRRLWHPRRSSRPKVFKVREGLTQDGHHRVSPAGGEGAGAGRVGGHSGAS